jgi:DNA-binding XRE family transcriptional regulator
MMRTNKYGNLEAEMARVGMKRGDLADLLGVRKSTISFKLNGRSKFTLDECIEIKRALGVDMSIDALFYVPGDGEVSKDEKVS